MPIRLSNSLLAEIRAHAARDYPHECCGVLLGTTENDVKTVTALRAMPNVHEEGHERRYLIPPDEMFRLEQEARVGSFKILGFYHSHPDHPARPSEYDREWAWPWYSYIIISVIGGEPREMTCWTLDDDREAFSAETILSS
ncbi:MAG TPA: M67 family metallopeptidase [Chthonomonadales bacterium]|nr:M67 family metallopeptidase [Chthonomonadales bacterium]